jgi:hypothetical protein
MLCDLPSLDGRDLGVETELEETELEETSDFG